MNRFCHVEHSFTARRRDLHRMLGDRLREPDPIPVKECSSAVACNTTTWNGRSIRNFPDSR